LANETAYGKARSDAAPKSVANKKGQTTSAASTIGPWKEPGPTVRTGQSAWRKICSATDPEEQLPEALSTVCADDEQINLLLVDDLVHLFPYIALTNEALPTVIAEQHTGHSQKY
jgi:hypothetical protein